jgi:hypothetical protein
VNISKSPIGDLDSKWVSQTLRDSSYPTVLDTFINDKTTPQTKKSELEFEFVQNELLVDVTDTCHFNINTGIQRVVRNLVRELLNSKVPLRLVTWNASETALRELTETELKIVTGLDISLGHDPAFGLQDPEHYVSLIPTNCKLFIPELATQTLRVKRTICIGKNTSNQLFAIGYDAVPILLPDTTSKGMVSAFALQLEMLKHCTSIFGISDATTREYKDLFSGLNSHGLVAPEVVTVSLPLMGIQDPKSRKLSDGGVARLLVVGSHEPRKNHEQVLAAAETLWQESYEFELHFVALSCKEEEEKFIVTWR